MNIICIINGSLRHLKAVCLLKQFYYLFTDLLSLPGSIFYIFFFFEREGVFAPCAMLGGFPWVASLPVLPAAIVINNSVLYYNMSVFLFISIYSSLIYTFYIYIHVCSTLFGTSPPVSRWRLRVRASPIFWDTRQESPALCRSTQSLSSPSFLLNWGFFYSPGHAPLPLK